MCMKVQFVLQFTFPLWPSFTYETYGELKSYMSRRQLIRCEVSSDKSVINRAMHAHTNTVVLIDFI